MTANNTGGSTLMNLGDNVKYTDEDGNEILAVIQKKQSDGKIVISLCGEGKTIAVEKSEVSSDLSI